MATPKVRPPSLPPNIARTSTPRIPTVTLRHPGYGFDNILLDLPAVDGTTTTTPGLHQRTVLTAGAIIADNAFDRVYLTRDQAGSDRVDATLPLDGLLEPGDYWLQLNGYEPFREAQEDTRAVMTSMPPPAPPRPTSTSATRTRNPLPTSIPNARESSRPPSSDTSPQTTPQRNIPYPIVPSFGDWQFPHNQLPAEWKQCRLAPQPTPTPSSSHMSSTPSRRCWITGYHMGINECHMAPKNQDAWWAANDMRQYTTAGFSRDEANIALLRADIHQILDGHKFAIIPKPSLSSSSESSASSSFAFAAHVLKSDDEAREFWSLYHNVAMAQAGVDRLSPEFLFARFAWAIFADLQPFLSSSITRRHLAVMVRTDTNRYTELKQMDGQEWTMYLAVRGVTRSGSRTRKRSSSQMTQEGNDRQDTDDAYHERWKRRSRSLEGADPSSGGGSSDDDLDLEMRQVRINTRWYDEVGRFSQGDLEQEQLDRNTRWYDEVGRFSQGDLEQEQLDRNTRWYDEVGQFARAGLSDGEEQSKADEADRDSDLECEHGPSRGRRHHLGSSPPGSDGMPHLSRSFTTRGSNRSSSPHADLPGCEDENGADPGFYVNSAVPRDKVLGAVDGPIADHDPSVDEHLLPS
ncbi:hypothetical protein diail_6525 [Diaporthe ilicicola]|nr:hypothetical protein diail_6525 [Diaporthe ilicicola]